MKHMQLKIGNIALVALMALGLGACVQTGGGSASKSGGGAASSSSSTGGSSVTGGGDSGTTTPTNLVAQEVTNVGVKNFDQLNTTYSVLTGVPITNTNVNNEFTALKAALPLNNDIRSFSGATQTAVVKLASRYCREAIATNNTVAGTNMTTRQLVLPANLLNANNQTIAAGNITGQTPAVVFTAANNAKIADYMIDHFWGRGTASAPTQDDAAITQLILDLMNGEANTTAITQAVLIGVCTSALANTNVITL